MRCLSNGAGTKRSGTAAGKAMPVENTSTAATRSRWARIPSHSTARRRLTCMKLLLLFCIVAPAFCQASFTVASVKTSAAQEGKLPRIVIDPGRLDLTNVSLKTLITRAYSVKDYQVTGPEWIGSDRFTVVATMPPETPPAAV